MKPTKIILFTFLGLFLISLIFVGFAASHAISCGMDRPQWEEDLTEWDYFLAWSCISLIVNIILCSISIAINLFISWAFRHQRRAIMKWAWCLHRKVSNLNVLQLWIKKQKKRNVLADTMATDIAIAASAISNNSWFIVKSTKKNL